MQMSYQVTHLDAIKVLSLKHNAGTLTKTLCRYFNEDAIKTQCFNSALIIGLVVDFFLMGGVWT